MTFGVLLVWLSSAQHAAAQSFMSAHSLATARAGHTATLLPSGRVLVAGGGNSTADLASVEVYDRGTNVWSPAASLAIARDGHTATLLSSGTVLVTGGANAAGGYLQGTELYDPATNTWSSKGFLAVGRTGHTATLLQNGKVLVVAGTIAGFSDSSYLASAELYNPATGEWSSAGSLAVGRGGHTATLLQNGKVLVAGGYGTASFVGFSDVEIYDPTTNSWSAAGSLAVARSSHTATLLPSGKVLVAGGIASDFASYLASVELYDPATNSWSPAGSLGQGRGEHTATLLPNGKVLVVGGQSGNNAFVTIGTAEIYDPATNVWSSASSLLTARFNPTATLLQNGTVLIAAGVNASSSAISSVEIFNPSGPAVPALPTVMVLLAGVVLAAVGWRALARPATA
jgi:N-acetylneuraminic acid mutarotase